MWSVGGLIESWSIYSELSLSESTLIIFMEQNKIWSKYVKVRKSWSQKEQRVGLLKAIGLLPLLWIWEGCYDNIWFRKRFDKIWKTIWYHLKGFGKRWDLKLKPGAPLACCCCFWMLVKTVASAPSLELFSTVYFHMHVFPNCWLCGKLGWAGFKKSPQRFSLRTCLHCKFSYVFPNCWRTELRRV